MSAATSPRLEPSSEPELESDLKPEMPRARRQRRVLPAEVRTGHLIAAAAELFLSKGLDATTVDDIVARAGVAKGTFYHYFTTKADVLLALRARFSQDFNSRAQAAIDACAPDDHHARFRAWLRGAVSAYVANFRLHDVVFHDFTHDRRRSQEKDMVIDQLAALLDAGQKAGAWNLPDTRAAAFILFDGMHGVVDDAIASARLDPEPLCEILEDMLGRMLTR